MKSCIRFAENISFSASTHKIYKPEDAKNRMFSAKRMQLFIKVCQKSDVQNTFCLPDFELFVSGRSGTGAVDDNRRLCEFIYRHISDPLSNFQGTPTTARGYYRKHREITETFCCGLMVNVIGYDFGMNPG